jgi:hypothetical protein
LASSVHTACKHNTTNGVSTMPCHA